MNRPLTFCIYNDEQDRMCWSAVTLRDLLALQRAQHVLFARAENSGSEGCYVEIARWKEGTDCHTGQWQSYAFQKFFGGELWRGFDDKTTCERLANLINGASRHMRFTGFIHSLPHYSFKPIPEHPALTALRELELRTRQFLAGQLITFPVALLPQCRAVITQLKAGHH